MSPFVRVTVNIAPRERAMLAQLVHDHADREASITNVLRALIHEAYEQAHGFEEPPPWTPDETKSRAGKSKRKKSRPLDSDATLTLRVDATDPRVAQLLKTIGAQ